MFIFSDIQPIISDVKFSTFQDIPVFSLKLTGPQKTIIGGFNLYEIGEHNQHE